MWEVLIKSMPASSCQLACAKKNFQPWEKERGSTGLWIKVGAGLNGKCDLINDAWCLVDTAIRKDKSSWAISSKSLFCLC